MKIYHWIFAAGVIIVAQQNILVYSQCSGDPCSSPCEVTYGQGFLQSTKFPNSVGGAQQCTWNFNVANANLVYVVIETLDLNGANLTIFDGQTQLSTADLIVPASFLLSATTSNVKFETPKNATFHRVFFSWQVADDVIPINGYNGIIQSPRYAGTSNISVNYVITGSGDAGLILSFIDFNVFDGSVTIKSNQNSTATFSGVQRPRDTLATLPNIFINTTLNAKKLDQGFVARYDEVFLTCSSYKKVDSTMTVNLFPAKSVLPSSCILIFESPASTVMLATLTNWTSVMQSTHNRLTLRDGGSTFSNDLGVFSTENAKDTSVVTSGNYLWVKYSFIEDTGLNVTLDVSVHNIGSTLYNSGSFGLPPVKNQTVTYNTSVWLLTATPGQQVYLDIHSPVFIDNSRIVIYDGVVINQTNLLTSYDANSTIVPVASSKSHMIVVAENFVGNSSFNATFSGVSEKTFKFSASTASSCQVLEVEPKSNFTWMINPVNKTETDVIEIYMNLLTVGTNASVVVYEGLTVKDAVLANVTSSISDLVIYVSAKRGALIVYQNLGNVEVAGLLINSYYQVSKGCNSNVTLSEEVTLVSPLYPKLYPVYADCTFTLSLPSNKSMLLSFEDVQLANDHYVIVTNGSSSFNVTGSNAPDDFITADGPIYIKFSSKSVPTNLTRGRGFKIRAIPLDCGGHYADKQQTFMTPNYPNPTKNTLCIWSVALPSAADVEIFSVSIESKAVSTSKSKLYFVDGGNVGGLINETINSSVSSYLSRTNKIIIVYNGTLDSTSEDTPFKLSYVPKVCRKEQLCKNGICMHDDWKCNGINDCGDFTDEYNCNGITPETSSGGVAVSTFIVVMILMFMTGAAVTLAAPVLWKKFRSPRDYQSFTNSVDA